MSIQAKESSLDTVQLSSGAVQTRHSLGGEDMFTVQQASELTGLSEHTLRYYERAGLIRPIHRDDSSRHRRYSAADIATLDILACLRAVGLPLEDMREYMTLRPQGAAAARQQQQLLEDHQRVLEQRLQQTQRHLKYVQHKIAYWRAVEAHDDQAATIAKQAADKVRVTQSSSPALEND